MVRPFRAQSSLWTGTQGVALGARNAPLGLNTTAHPYCTGRLFSRGAAFLHRFSGIILFSELKTLVAPVE